LSFLVKELAAPGTDSGTKKLGKSSTCVCPGSWGHGGTPGATGQASNTVKQKGREINDLTVLLACLFYLEGAATPASQQGRKKVGKSRVYGHRKRDL
jgi:hypothetical protein